jgi:probable phosphoglycerate mutase
VSTFYLIRHAENDWVGKRIAGWLPEVHLNEQGRAQAEVLAERLARSGIGAIYSSPLERAVETAAPLARRLGLEVQTSDAIGEVHFGDWTGCDLAALEADPRWRWFNTFRSGARIPGGELMIETQTRFVAELERLRDREPGGTVAVVSHGDPIKAALAHYAGIQLDLFHRLEISPASVSVVVLEEWGPRLLRINAEA